MERIRIKSKQLKEIYKEIIFFSKMAIKYFCRQRNIFTNWKRGDSSVVEIRQEFKFATAQTGI